MSKPDDILIQSTSEILANQMKKLNSLLDMREFRVLNYYLKSIFGTLFNRKEIADEAPPLSMYLDLPKQEKLAQICIRIFDCEASNWRSRIYAIKILSLLVKQLSDQSSTAQKTLNMVCASLVKKLHPPRNPIAPDGYRFIEDAVKLKGLSAYCLNRIEPKHIILSPLEAHKLIRDSILPLAIWCLTMETKHEKSTFKVFENDFHGFFESNSDNVLNEDSFYTYPLVIRLLVPLTRYSESALLGGFRQELDMILEEASKADAIKDKHVVALNVAVAAYRNAFVIPIEFPKKIVTSLLLKSEGLYRVHLAYIAYRVFWPSQPMDYFGIRKEQPRNDEHRRIFTKAMLDDLITKNDELLAEIALHSLWTCIDEGDDDYWRRLLKGKEIAFVRKLLEINCGLGAYKEFLRRFDCFRDSQLSLEFDQLTRISISQHINKLDHFLTVVRRRNLEQTLCLEEHLECLMNLLRLRRHRLQDQAEELKLLELFDLLIDAKITRVTLDPSILFVFANSYQVHQPNAWATLVKLLRYAQQPLLELAKTHQGFVFDQSVTRKLLSHFLMIDPDNFYANIATLEVLELIYNFSKRALETVFVEALLKEILLCWPEDYRKTKLNSNEYRKMLVKFIELLIRKLAVGPTNRPAAPSWERCCSIYPEVVVRSQFFDLSSGLVAVFSRHREALFDVLHKTKLIPDGRRDEWLMQIMWHWTQLIINYKSSLDNSTREHFIPFGLANVVVAHEGLMMFIKEKRFNEFLDIRESLKALSKFVKSSCDKGLQQSPVDSIVSKRYQQIKARLPEA